MNDKIFYFTSVIWGKEYISFFLKWVISSLLADKNIPYLSSKEKCFFIFYTIKDDVELLYNSEQIKLLSNYVEINFKIFEGIDKVGKYQSLAQCHQNLISSYNNKNNILIFIHSDVIYANGNIKKLYEIEKKGKRAIVNWEPRVKREKIEKEIKKFQKNLVTDIPNRKLVNIAMKNLHSENEMMVWNKNFVKVSDPHHLIFKVDDNGLLVRSFILNPILINPQDRTIKSEYNLDADYLFKAFNTDEIYCITDTDEFCTLDFTKENDRQDNIIDVKLNTRDVANWTKFNTNRLHQHYFKKTIFFHSKGINKSWNSSKDQSKKICEEILLFMKKEKKQNYSAPSKIKFDLNFVFQKSLTLLLHIYRFNFKIIFKNFLQLYRNFFKGKLVFIKIIKYSDLKK